MDKFIPSVRHTSELKQLDLQTRQLIKKVEASCGFYGSISYYRDNCNMSERSATRLAEISLHMIDCNGEIIGRI